VSYVRFLARRVAFAALSAYLVVTATFALITFTPNPQLGAKLASAARFNNASPEELEQIRQRYLENRGLDGPVLERYADWLVDVTTLNWGYSFSYERPVMSVLEATVPETLEYVVPGVVIAIVLGVLLGLVAALAKGSGYDWSVRVLSYALLGIPVFIFVPYFSHGLGETSRTGLHHFFFSNTNNLAILVVAVSLLSGQLRFARAASLEEAGQEFVKLLRAKGAGRIRTARHILRNASIPIVSLSITEILTVLMLNIYVIETVLGINGLARASLRAVRGRDMPLIIGTTMVLVFIGIGGNLVQDVLYGYLDPRIEE
jgi:peptide/nickel transport system permease protein